MKFTSRFIAATTLAAGLVALAATPAAQAGNVSWSVGVGLPGVQLGVPVGLVNPQRVYAPQVVYTQPAQVYGRAAPVYLQPQPVYVQPQAAYYPATVYPQQVYAQPSQPYYGSPYPVVRQPVVYAPAPVYRSWGGGGFGYGGGYRGDYGGHGHDHHHGFGHGGGYR